MATTALMEKKTESGAEEESNECSSVCSRDTDVDSDR